MRMILSRWLITKKLDKFQKGVDKPLFYCYTMFGDVVMEDMDMVECYEEDSAFDHVDEESHVVYFVDAQDYDE